MDRVTDFEWIDSEVHVLWQELLCVNPFSERINMAIVKTTNTKTGRKTAVQKSSVAQIYNEFLSAKKNQVAPGTLEIYKKTGYAVIIPELMRLTNDDLFSVTTKNLRDLIDNYAQDHNTGGVAFIHRHLKCFLRWVWDEYEIDRTNPISKVPVKKSKTKPLTGIDWDKINAMIDAAKKHSTFPERDIAIIMVLADTGIRRGSLLGMKMGDVDLDHAQMKVFEKDQDYHVKTFGYATEKAIRKYLDCLDNIKPTDPFWIRMDGCALSQFGMKEVLHRLCVQAGIEPQSFHDFRRFYALELYMSTRDIYFVSRALDHKSVEVTKRYLALDIQNDLEEIRSVSPMDKRFRQTGIRVAR